MSMSESIIPRFLNNLSEESNQALKFQNVTEIDLSNLNNNAKEIDLDYILISDKCEKLFENTAVLHLLRSHTGRFLNFAEFENLYSSTAKNTLKFATLDKYQIAVPLENTSSSDENDENLNSTLCKTINGCLSLVHTNPMSFAEFKDHLLRNFANFKIAVYAFGQKEPLREVEDDVKNIAGTCFLEIAIAREYELENMFICAKFQKNYAKFSFSNFLSNSAVNLRINDQILSTSVVKGSYRTVVYNSFQHKKKHHKWIINKRISRNEEKSSFNFLLQNFYDTFKQNLAQFALLSNEISNNKLRIESYFNILRSADIVLAKNSINVSINKFDYVKCSNDFVSNYIRNSSQCVLRLLDECYHLEKPEATALFALVYERLVSGIFSLSLCSAVFKAENYGVGLYSRFFDVRDFCFTSEFWTKTTASKVWKLFENIFGTNISMLDVRLAFFSTLLFPNTYPDNFLSVAAFYVSKLHFFLRKASLECARKHAAQKNAEIVPLEKWLNIYKELKKKNQYVLESINVIDKWSKIQTDSYNLFLEKISNTELYVYYKKQLYFFRTCSSLCSTEFGIESILDIPKNISFESCADLLNGTRPVSSPLQFNILMKCDKLRQLIRDDFNVLCKNFDDLSTFEIDDDQLLRFIFAAVPSNISKHPQFFYSILKLCKDFETYLRLCSISIYIYLNPTNQPQLLRKHRENHGKKFVKIDDFKPLTTINAIFCFGFIGYYQNANMINMEIDTTFKKAKFGVPLFFGKRLKLLPLPNVCSNEILVNAVNTENRFDFAIQMNDEELQQLATQSFQNDSLLNQFERESEENDSEDISVQNEVANLDAMNNPDSYGGFTDLIENFNYFNNNNLIALDQISTPVRTGQNLTQPATETETGQSDSDVTSSSDENHENNDNHDNQRNPLRSTVNEHQLQSQILTPFISQSNSQTNDDCPQQFLQKLKNDVIFDKYYDQLANIGLTSNKLRKRTVDVIAESLQQLFPSINEFSAELLANGLKKYAQ